MATVAHLAAAAFAIALAGCGKPDVTYDNVATQPVDVASAAAAPKPIQLKTTDGVTVFGLSYSAPRPKALILLFHQAGSSKDEYATIAPRLVEAGYSALAIDQCSGGSLFGTNETVAALGQSGSYLDAARDLQAAIDWAKTSGQPIILWGSSYSSSLVFPVAAANPGRVRAVLAFSPGEYFDDKQLVERAAAKLTVPVFITSASNPDEIAAAKVIADAVPGGKAEDHVPETGVHGSSTLIAAKDPKGAEGNWQAVLAFLGKVAP